MTPMPSSIRSTVRAAAFPFVFINLRKRFCFPAFCGVLPLMLSGACVGVYAQSANFGSVNVGSSSPTPISITLTFHSAETLGSISVVTQGATGLDFSDVGTGTCREGTSYGAAVTCTVDVSFTPRFPGTRYGAAELLDGSGNVLATGYVQGTGVGPLVTFVPGTQSVVASSATNGLAEPRGVAVDGSGNVYIADFGGNRVLKETLSAGTYTQSVVADSTTNGLFGPERVAVDGSGNVYISENGGTEVLKETPSTGGYIQSVVVANSTSNGLSGTVGVAVDGSGNVYLSDIWTGQVLKETLSAGTYTQSVVADSTNNGLTYPYGVAVDGSGNVYIADSYFDGANSGQVLKETLSAGGYTQSVVASAATNGLTGPDGIAVDGSGNVYIADGFNDTLAGVNYSRVLKETPSAGGYTQSLIANASDNGLNSPAGVAVDGSGNVYIAEAANSQALKEDFADPPSLTIVASRSKVATVINDGNAPLIFALPPTGDNPSVSANFAWDPSSTCRQATAGSSAAYQLAAGKVCTMAFDFRPTMTGTFSGLAELTDNNLNVAGAVQSIQLIGVLGSQTITFPQTASPVYNGVAPITLTATGGASGNPVVFSIVSGPGSLSGTNNSVLDTTGTGTIVIAANQAGNADYTAAPQVTRSITVLYSKLAALTTPAPGSALTGSSATFTWSPGVGPTEYMLYLGSTGVRSNNLYNSGPTTTTSVNVTGLPINGETIYARLYSLIGGAWHCLDYTYTAASLQATLISPVPGSTLTGSSETFTWSAGAAFTQFDLFLGSNGPGSDNLYRSGFTTAKSVNVTGLPVNGEKIYARLYSYAGGAWNFLDYIYKAE